MDTDDMERYSGALHAELQSGMPDGGVGAMLVSQSGERRWWDYTRLPKGIELTDELLAENYLRRELTIHAELGVLLGSPFDTEGGTLYCTKFPCLRCAVAMLEAGVTRLVCPTILGESRWAPSQRRAKNALIKAGVTLDTFNPEDILG